jgi:hypothetical protein
MTRALLLLVLVLATAAGAQPLAEHVVLVSIDGLAAYHIENDELEIRNIRAWIRDGVWAESSETVFPSVTHPAHTTLLMGVLPRVHGVIGKRLANRETGERFHVTNRKRSESVRVPTIFDAAKAKGLRRTRTCPPSTRSSATSTPSRGRREERIDGAARAKGARPRARLPSLASKAVPAPRPSSIATAR